ncbi:MAG: hypothetical protein ACXVPQ_01520 [Bacteroidia bacterium]
MAFLLLEPDGSIQKDLLLFLFQVLQSQLVTDDFPLVKNDK